MKCLQRKNVSINFIFLPRVVSKPPYEVKETGWGEFEIQIKIYFNDLNEKPGTHFEHLNEVILLFAIMKTQLKLGCRCNQYFMYLQVIVCSLNIKAVDYVNLKICYFKYVIKQFSFKSSYHVSRAEAVPHQRGHNKHYLNSGKDISYTPHPLSRFDVLRLIYCRQVPVP